MDLIGTNDYENFLYICARSSRYLGLSNYSSTASRSPCLAAARSHFGSDSHLDCHSLPKCRYATSQGKARYAQPLRFFTAVRSCSGSMSPLPGGGWRRRRREEKAFPENSPLLLPVYALSFSLTRVRQLPPGGSLRHAGASQ